MDKITMLMMICAANEWGMPAVPGRRHYEKPEKECLLEGCDERTSHNGGYCCADHCREHKRIRKLNVSNHRTEARGSVGLLVGSAFVYH